MDYYRFDSRDRDLDKTQRKIIQGCAVIRDVLNSLTAQEAVSTLTTVAVSTCKIVNEVVGHDGFREVLIKALEDSRLSNKE